MNRTDSEITTQSTLRINIPIMLTSFIGRKRELAEVKRLLATSRLVTVTGAAGCGKTRLTLRIASEGSIRYVHGVHWVELARLSDSRLVSQAVAKAVNVVEQPGRLLVDRLLDALQDKQLLLVLDNCEHLLTACAQLVESLVAVPGVSILATSREPFGITGEMLYPLSPMALPPVSLPADELSEAERGDKHALPHVILAVVARLQTIEHEIAAAVTAMPKVRLQTPSGQWLRLYASRLNSSAEQGQVAVMFEVAHPVEIAPLIMQAYHFTKREGEVTHLLLQGCATTQIAAALHVSSNTVQDHLKAIFEKVNVRSRRELTGRIFAQQYQPHFMADAPYQPRFRAAPLDVSGRLISLDRPSTEISTASSQTPEETRS